MTLQRPTSTIFFILTAVLIDMVAVGVIMSVLLMRFSVISQWW